ncbi:hypothetical protein GZH53_13470 [Flavihumibacter sp. R14]|nr:hypothetical protein [Flavihumibacter soli]
MVSIVRRALFRIKIKLSPTLNPQGPITRENFIKQYLRLTITYVIFLTLTLEVTAQEQKSDADTTQVDSVYENWGSISPGKGFEVARTKFGTLNISAYMLARYMNQLPATDTLFTDHLDRPRTIDPRQDILWHRVMVWFQGWIYSQKLRYTANIWTVNATNQVAVAGFMTYHFHKAFKLSAGINGFPGTRSLLGSHPLWLGTDRVMADEYFRPGFTSGIWAAGELFPGFNYQGMLGDNLSELGISAAKLTRNLGYGINFWYMPTTREFGPRGSYGDWEYHEKIATRFGGAFTHHRENRFSNLDQRSPDNTAIRLSDATLFFETGALADGVTIEEADYDLLAFDAALKYKGIFLQAEYYIRKLSDFDANGALPMSDLEDTGFYVQAAAYLIPKKLELYGATSQIYGSFNNSSEYLGGMNYYPFDTRNMRINAQVINVHGSPVSSVFGYYTGGQKGTTVSVAASIFF